MAGKLAESWRPHLPARFLTHLRPFAVNRSQVLDSLPAIPRDREGGQRLPR